MSGPEFRSTNDRTLEVADAVLHRLGGASHQAVALLYDVPVSIVKKRLRRAIREKLVPAERLQIIRAPIPAMSDAEYNAKWLAKVKAGCIVTETGCHVWQKQLTAKGYGQANYRGASVPIHRMVYKIVHGVKLAFSEHVCHSCDVRACCNEDHLWLGTAHQNQMDSAIKKRHRNSRKTHCKRGHELAGDNLVINSEGIRVCVTCDRARMRIRNGWPVDLAFSLPALPPGQWPVMGHGGKKRRAA